MLRMYLSCVLRLKKIIYMSVNMLIACFAAFADVYESTVILKVMRRVFLDLEKIPKTI